MGSHHDPASEMPAASSEMLARAEAPEAAAPAVGAETDGAAGTDTLSNVLQTVKLSGALFFVVEASTPWGMDVPHADVFAPIILPRARHVISYHIVTAGSGWLVGPTDAPIRFEAGDIVVFPHGDPYAMLSAPGQPPVDDAIAFFRAMAAGELPLVYKEGGGGPDRTDLVCGFLGCDTTPFNPLLAALPRLMLVRRRSGTGGDLLDRLIELTMAEVRSSRPGGESVRLRLSELMFVEVVRRYLETLPADQTGWLAGLRDPGIGRALALLHDRPANPWTIEELARQVGMSRSVLADRFAHLVGQPPMQYLTRWRIQVAARMLADGAAKITSISQDVGYASEAAFSRSFKRITGLSPAAWRERYRAA